MILDDGFDNEFDRYALTQEAGDWGDAIPELEWDECEARNIASELIGKRNGEY